MSVRRPVSVRLTPAEQQALASFLMGRLPAGRLEAELSRARAESALPPTEVPASALRAA